MNPRTYFTLLGLMALLSIVWGLILFRFVEGRAESGATSGSPPTAGIHETVSVALREGSVTPNKGSIPQAGPVTFQVKNLGTVAHEMVVLKTDLPANALTVAAGKVKEEVVGKVIGEIEEFPPNTTEEMTLDLAAGRYVLFCNVLEPGQTEGHYQKEMRVAFTVGSPSD